MNDQNLSNPSSLLAVFAAYLFVCGASAILFPTSWLWSAGLPTSLSPELSLVFGVLGAYLLSLAVAAWIASRNPVINQSIVKILLISQVLDFFTTLQAVYSGGLPRLPGTLFLVVTVVWSTLLGRILYETRGASNR
ncbi:MAG: hypothetical protein ACK5GN_00985 [Pseudomonadota bacterium]|jgi:hypothetical protein